MHIKCTKNGLTEKQQKRYPCICPLCCTNSATPKALKKRTKRPILGENILMVKKAKLRRHKKCHACCQAFVPGQALIGKRRVFKSPNGKESAVVRHYCPMKRCVKYNSMYRMETDGLLDKTLYECVRDSFNM